MVENLGIYDLRFTRLRVTAVPCLLSSPPWGFAHILPSSPRLRRDKTPSQVRPGLLIVPPSGLKIPLPITPKLKITPLLILTSRPKVK